MRKAALASLVALAVLSGAAGLLLWGRWAGPGWTSSSPEALAALERGLEARMRMYGDDAGREFRQAVALDPEFVAPRLFLLEMEKEGEERERLRAEIASADRGRLTEREAFLSDYFLAVFGGPDRAAAARLLDGFLTRHPDDPWALQIAAVRAWDQGDWERARGLFLRLLEEDPNWVQAHNLLGYMAMAQGRFEDAEERLRTYAFAAPDQANPHDSLGELLVLLGRYDEARAELEKALAVRPDFCASYVNLVRIELLTDREEAAAEVIGRVAARCPAEQAAAMRCFVSRWSALRRGEPETYWSAAEQVCPGKSQPFDTHLFRLALFADRRQEAEAQLARAREHLSQVGKRTSLRSGQVARGVVAHFEGLLRLRDGDPQGAAERLGAADGSLLYFSDLASGLLKLSNRATLALALDRTGKGEEAAALRREIAAVNPLLGRFDDTLLVAVPSR